MAQKRTLIIHYTAGRLFAVAVILVALLAGALLSGYLYGDKLSVERQRYNEALKFKVVELADRLQGSQDTLTAVKLTAEIDAAALEETRQHLVALQGQIYSRDQELKLYREMLQDNQQPKGLWVTDVHIEKLDNRRFQYDWIARQNIHEVKTLRVNAQLWIIGRQNGEVVNLPLDKVDADIDALPIQLKLKYFSINRGIVQLPDGFTPESVRVTLRYPWAKKPQFDNKFVWRAEE
jgi:hypothetical protein